MGRGIRKFIGNLIGAFIPGDRMRRRARVNIVTPLWRCLRFVRDVHGRDVSVQKFYGLGGKGLVLIVDNKYVYKFSCRANANTAAKREYDIVNYFKEHSSIRIPGIKLLQNGEQLVRRIDYVAGTTLADLPPDTIIKNANKLGKQIAKFLFEIATQDPECLKKYKPNPDARPQMFCGWNHNDWNNLENYIVDKDTMKITALIDWEEADFNDFKWRFTNSCGQLEKIALFDVVIREYIRLWNGRKSKKTR